MTMINQQIGMSSRSGATFSYEKGWIATESGEAIILQEPGKELSFTLLENNQDGADNAILSAWHTIQPDFSRMIKHKQIFPATDGWDEMVQYIYDTSTAEDKFLLAFARRLGTTWYVGLIDGTPGALSRRGAGVSLIFTSFKIPGMAIESFAGKVAHKLDQAKLAELIDFIEQARILCKIPGAALGIVQDGKFICAQGFGVKQLGTQDLVTPTTQFMIGSTTKSLTTLMMAKLVEEGKFSWDTPVIKVLPMFALGDKATTEKLLMKHTVSANTGMPRHDIECVFNFDHATPELRLAEMKEMKPTTGFGETFQYSNNMVMAGGYIAGHAAYPDVELGVAYDNAMQSRVFDPLHMSSTTCDIEKLTEPAHPHGQNLQGDYTVMPIDADQWAFSIRPAGALWSNLYDMANYLIMELNKGVTAQGDLIISQINLLERRKPQIMISDKMYYGLGLMTQDDHGVTCVGHGGNTMGFTSEMLFLPEYNVGLVLLTNAEGANIFTAAVFRKLMELLFDGKDQAQAMIVAGQEQHRNMITKNLEKINFSPEAQWCQQFIGSYAHPVLGIIEILQNEDTFELDARVWKGTLGQEKDEDGSLQLILTDGLIPGLTFTSKKDEAGIVTQLILDDSQQKYIFERQK